MNQEQGEWNLSFYENGVYGDMWVPSLELRACVCNERNVLVAKIGNLSPVVVATGNTDWYNIPDSKDRVRTEVFVCIDADDAIFVAACNNAKIPEYLKLRLVYSLREARRELDNFVANDPSRAIDTIKRKWQDTSSWCMPYKMAAGLARPFSQK